MTDEYQDQKENREYNLFTPWQLKAAAAICLLYGIAVRDMECVISGTAMYAVGEVLDSCSQVESKVSELEKKLTPKNKE